MSNIGKLMRATKFAAYKHRDQRRKGEEAHPYINHPIQVAELLTRVGDIDDIEIVMAALLHDTVEDTNTTFDELEHEFGKGVSALVGEVTDDKTLAKAERKRRQVEHTAELSDRAKLIKLADKTCNVRDIGLTPPPDWDYRRRADYLDWAERVVSACRGINSSLEQCFDDALAEGRKAMAAED